ncbi:MAG: hypothetical protein QUS14_10945 [Pyrinomonadaceae bacterium]|nr:hypothetical protein [Pyrinomonadaceae bacterium]
MEFLSFILFLLANNWITALVVSILTCLLGFGWFAFAWSSLKANRAAEDGGGANVNRIQQKLLYFAVIGAFFLSIGVFVFSLVNMIFPHVLDGYLIVNYGNTADARVTGIEATSKYLNKSRVMRHNVIFKTAAGENYETHFETWDFNVYPSANSVRYPGQGEAFRVAYLPSFPSAFVILTDDGSDFSRKQECSDALAEIETARIKLEFDRNDPEFKRAYGEAVVKAAELKCPVFGRIE